MYVEISEETAINTIEDLERRLTEANESRKRQSETTDKLYDTIYALRDELSTLRQVGCQMRHYDPLGTIPTVKIIRAALGYLTEEQIGEIVRSKAQGGRTGGLKMAKDLFDAARAGGELAA